MKIKKMIPSLLAIILTVNSLYIPGARAAGATTQVAAASVSGKDYLLKVREELVKAQDEVNKKGLVSTSTLVTLGVTIAGAAIFGVAGFTRLFNTVDSAGYSFASHLGNVVTGMGGAVGGAAPILNSLLKQAQNLLHFDVTADLDARSKKLVEVIDAALISQTLKPEQAQKLLELRKSLVERSEYLKNKPYYLKAVNFIDGTVTVVGVLLLAIALTGCPQALLADVAFMVPATIITNILRTIAEAYLIRDQRKAVAESIATIDSIINEAQGKDIILLP
ncbi:MAG TPA: hypothetical protein VN132_03120 [Bdellovibrio sp.]|nr:hypothetical protein [Bdellovibrio sp.]